MIRLGNTYNQKYLGNNFSHEEIPVKPGYVKSYLVQNKPNSQIFKGVLNVLENGKAVMFVNYVSYSGVKNKYENYFALDGAEIIHDKNSTREEKKYWKVLK